MLTMEAHSLEEKALARKWFYEYELPSGKKTELYIPPSIAPIHTTRRDMMFSVLDPLFHNCWADMTCLDFASHEGYFSIQLARRGCRDVLGIDARQDHVDQASLMRDIYGLANLNFQLGDVRSIDLVASTPADIVIMFGLIYHLENPLQALYLAAKLTKKICLVETQVTPNISGVTDWGANFAKKHLVGTFSLIDEMDEINGPEASVSGLSLCPSQEAVIYAMQRFGFSKVGLVPVPSNGYEQLQSGNRIMVMGFK